MECVHVRLIFGELIPESETLSTFQPSLSAGTAQPHQCPPWCVLINWACGAYPESAVTIYLEGCMGLTGSSIRSIRHHLATCKGTPSRIWNRAGENDFMKGTTEDRQLHMHALTETILVLMRCMQLRLVFEDQH